MRRRWGSGSERAAGASGAVEGAVAGKGAGRLGMGCSERAAGVSGAVGSGVEEDVGTGMTGIAGCVGENSRGFLQISSCDGYFGTEGVYLYD